MTTTNSTISFESIFYLAQEAATKAFYESEPTPVAVQASGLGEEFDPNKPYSIMRDGLCGFAWVTVFVDGRSKMAKQMMKYGLRSDYQGGYNFWSSSVAPCSSASQSVTRKEAACEAFAEVLRNYGITAYAESRLD